MPTVLATLGLLASVIVGGGSTATAATPSTTAVTTPAATSATDVGRPAWWNGDCDANRFNSIAASYGWDGVGAHRMGASYLGVPVCGPRPWVDGSPNVLWGRAGWGEAEWQCVELAQRFMAQVYGTKAYQANGSQVVRNYSTAYGGGLVKISNGTVGKAPVPGDVVSFTTSSNPWGHVGVIAQSTVDANGNGTVLMMSQNDTADGWRTLPVTNWRLGSLGSLSAYGWLHDPLGRGNPLGEGSFVRSSDSRYYYRIVGGAPVLVTTWRAFGGTQPFSIIDPQQFAKLRAYPRNGAYLKDTTTGQVYRMAGGAPLAVSAADAAKLPGWATAPKIGVDHWALVRRDHVRAVPADGSQICRVDNGSCYIVAGGAPLYVPSTVMATTPGWSSRTATMVSGAEFTSWTNLRATPADGTFVCDASTSACYVTAGGAPLLMGPTDPKPAGFNATTVVRAPHWEFARSSHLRSRPVEGTVLCPVGDRQCYVVAGGAPVAIAASSAPAVSTKAGVSIARTELRTPLRLNHRPVDGTLLKSAQTGALYVVEAGVARKVGAQTTSAAAATKTPVVIDQNAVDNAGMAGPWSHLASAPAVAELAAPTLQFQLSTVARLSWPVPVASSVVTTYDVRYQKASYGSGFGAWTEPATWSGLTATSLRLGIAKGVDYCFSVRAHNRAGQIGPWSASRCTTAPLDDSSFSSKSSGWRVGASPLFYGGSAMRAWTQGAWWKLSGVAATRLALVATTSPNGGRVAVWVNRTRVAVIDLSSPTVVYQKVFELPRFAAVSGATVTLVVTSATGKDVQLDGL
ncbi:MAG TPA: CHAP domain-containing protein, partial [Candidatus Nanopelagicales bacterium]|nr:CHAP domain-containing protein [Candidatus Nanopelagicales bacterium]